MDSYKKHMRSASREWVIMAMTESEGNFSLASELSGTDRANISRLAKKYGLVWNGELGKVQALPDGSAESRKNPPPRY